MEAQYATLHKKVISQIIDLDSRHKKKDKKICKHIITEIFILEKKKRKDIE